MAKLRSSEITPEAVYLSRRKLMVGVGAVVTAALVGAGCTRQESDPTILTETSVPGVTGTLEEPSATPSTDVAEPVDDLTSLEAVTNYNNFYEFTLSKEGVAQATEGFQTSPWMIEVGGLVNNARTFDLDDLLKFDQEERVYRMRCVEAWSMVIPWVGFPLAKLLKEVDPTSRARYVRFETLFDPDRMPGQKTSTFPWPYVEGLRVDEAMHNLTILATGLYGQSLLPQNGAPVRLVVPWKYGFKSIKSIVRIDLVEEMPTSLWMDSSPNEYGFWANVNPEVAHPRWSQATERRIGEGRRETLFLNGYADEVAGLYADLDSRDWYF